MKALPHIFLPAKLLLFACLLIIFCTACGNSNTIQIYVSKKGKDTNSGTKEAPYASPLAAKEAIAKLKKKDIKVLLN
jgi:hypothetical protein